MTHYSKINQKNNQFFIILAILRRSVERQRVVGLISATQRLGNKALKKRRMGDDTVSDLTGPEIEAQASRSNGNVLNNC